MAGAIAIVVALLLFPIIAALSGVIVAALLGSSLNADGVARNEGSELLDLNV